MTRETRSTFGEIRAATAEGVVEGYAAVWNTVDSYTSSFQRGAFAKTLQERGQRIKVLWNHSDEVIGRVIEAREDDHGLFVRAQLTLSTARATEVFNLIREGVIDTFSFGFRTIKDKWIQGVRHITEVALYEVSPVIFEANEAAVITAVRGVGDEARAEEYAKTYGQFALEVRPDLILSAHRRTLYDIMYADLDQDALRAKVSACWEQAAGDYLLYIEELLAARSLDAGLMPRGDALELAVRRFLTSSKQTPEQFAATTSLTLDEVRALLSGRVEVASEKLPTELQEAYAKARAEKVAALCDELRQGVTQPERDRIMGLLNPPGNPVVDDMLLALQSFRKTLQE